MRCLYQGVQGSETAYQDYIQFAPLRRFVELLQAIVAVHQVSGDTEVSLRRHCLYDIKSEYLRHCS